MAQEHFITDAFKFSGSKVAYNAPAERFVVTVGDQSIVVIAQAGKVCGHDVRGKTTGPAFKFNGSKVAFNGPVDRFVVMLGPRTAVITNVGDVFGHDNFDIVDIVPP